jgi:hypothetical protein
VIAEGGRPLAISMEQDPPRWGDPLATGPSWPRRWASQVASSAGTSRRRSSRPERRTRSCRPEAGSPLIARSPDGARLAAALRAVGGEGCYLYSLDPVDPDSAAYARFFNPTVGISEDPATGTAAGALAGHLVVADGSTVLIERGHRIGRPSRIEISVAGERVTI